MNMTAIRKAVARGFNLAWSVQPPAYRTLAQYNSITGTTYDPNAGQNVTSTTSVSLKAIVENYKAKTNEKNDIDYQLYKIHVLQKDLTVTPKLKDTVQVAGKTYIILYIEQDTAGMTWVFQARTTD